MGGKGEGYLFTAYIPSGKEKLHKQNFCVIESFLYLSVVDSSAILTNMVVIVNDKETHVPFEGSVCFASIIPSSFTRLAAGGQPGYPVLKVWTCIKSVPKVLPCPQDRVTATTVCETAAVHQKIYTLCLTSPPQPCRFG